jgi:hypothetical protein
MQKSLIQIRSQNNQVERIYKYTVHCKTVNPNDSRHLPTRMACSFDSYSKIKTFLVSGAIEYTTCAPDNENEPILLYDWIVQKTRDVPENNKWLRK